MFDGGTGSAAEGGKMASGRFTTEDRILTGAGRAFGSGNELSRMASRSHETENITILEFTRKIFQYRAIRAIIVFSKQWYGFASTPYSMYSRHVLPATIFRMVNYKKLKSVNTTSTIDITIDPILYRGTRRCELERQCLQKKKAEAADG